VELWLDFPWRDCGCEPCFHPWQIRPIDGTFGHQADYNEDWTQLKIQWSAARRTSLDCTNLNWRFSAKLNVSLLESAWKESLFELTARLCRVEELQLRRESPEITTKGSKEEDTSSEEDSRWRFMQTRWISLRWGILEWKFHCFCSWTTNGIWSTEFRDQSDLSSWQFARKTGCIDSLMK
jgi:hypothetical protein